MATKLFAFVIVFGVLAGCRNDVCARKSDCAQGLTCSAEGVCVGTPDGGVSQPSVDAAIDGGP
ncbi:MAG: hypothetical protein ABI591_13395 [Kofleriaceae bacterium]